MCNDNEVQVQVLSLMTSTLHLLLFYHKRNHVMYILSKVQKSHVMHCAYHVTARMPEMEK